MQKDIAAAGAGAGVQVANDLQKFAAETKQIPMDFQANITNWIRQNVPGQQCFGGSHAVGCPDEIKATPEQMPKTIVVQDQGFSGTPEFLASKIGSVKTDPYASQLTKTYSAPAAPTGVTKIGLTAEQRYAQTFAMPGSEAYKKAFGG